MMLLLLLLQLRNLVVLLLVLLPQSTYSSYEPTWESLDSRPLPQWYDQAKFGIFLHWGVFSVPSFGSEWFWNYLGSNDKRYAEFVNKTEGPRFSYQDYAKRFDATLYDPKYWADVFAQAGAQYVVLTSKHHEGYCMWDSRDVPTTWNWNVMDVGPKRDLLGDLSKEVKQQVSPYTGQPIKFGVYHSMFEWYNLLYTRDQHNQYNTNEFPKLKTIPELYDLVNKYEPDIVWSDGAWDASSDYWLSKEFLAWLATNSTVKDTVVWNDRWGSDTMCKHGSYFTCDDRYQPDSLQPIKWENCYTVDQSSWGFNRNATLSDYYSTKELIHTMIHTVALNGNFLLNIGPHADGTLSVAFVDRLLGIGEWLKVNGEAIYATRPWDVVQQQNSTYFTSKKDTVYALLTEWQTELTFNGPIPGDDFEVSMLGAAGASFGWDYDFRWGNITIWLPRLTPDTMPCQHAWGLVLEN